MLLVKLTTLRKLKLFVCIVSVLFLSLNASAQDNSPYSRYGLGNQAPSTSTANRGMGGIAAAYNDIFTVNYANPSSYAFFQTLQEANSNKVNSGRVVFNIGADAQGRTLIDQNAQTKYTSPNILFSHVMLGVPVRKNWGIAFGLRPLSNINYKIQEAGPKFDPNSHQLIDSAVTLYEGQGGSYLGSIGTGIKIKTGKSQFLSLGVNVGYLFGNRDYSTKLSFYNDSTIYAGANYQNKTFLHGLYLDAGLQYHFRASDKIYMSIGAYGNWQQKIHTTKDEVIETVSYDPESGYIPVDTAYSKSNIRSNFIYPSSITGGFAIQKIGGGADNEAGWLVGADFTRNNWDQFRFEGLSDTAVKSNWQLKLGAEFRPAPKKNYVSRAAYRVGFYTGPDYLYTRQTKIPVLGVTAGIGLPVANYNMQGRYQMSMINLSFEYVKRGNSTNLIKENLYRLSVGFSLTDLWFGGKIKYSDD